MGPIKTSIGPYRWTVIQVQLSHLNFKKYYRWVEQQSKIQGHAPTALPCFSHIVINWNPSHKPDTVLNLRWKSQRERERERERDQQWRRYFVKRKKERKTKKWKRKLRRLSEECRECYLHLLRKYSSHQSHCYFYFSLIIILCAFVNLFLCIPLSKLKRSRERCFTFFVWSVGTVMDSCTSNFLLIQCFLIFVSSTHLIKVNILTENSFGFKENLISFLLNFKFKHFFFG